MEGNIEMEAVAKVSRIIEALSIMSDYDRAIETFERIRKEYVRDSHMYIVAEDHFYDVKFKYNVFTKNNKEIMPVAYDLYGKVLVAARNININ